MKKMMLDFLTKLNNNEKCKLITTDVKQYVDKILSNATIIPIVKNGNLKAFIAFYENDEKRESAFLTMLAVENESFGLGYGKELLEMSIKEIKKNEFRSYELEVREDNLKAINLYQSFGFMRIQVKDGILYMKKTL